MLETVPATGGGRLPACTPSLMPFKISYTGPAPVSRYFHPKPPPPSFAALSLRSSSSATLVASSSSTSVLSETQTSLTAVSSTTSVGCSAQESECREDLLSSMTRPSVGMDDRMEQVTVAEVVMDTAAGTDSETQPASHAVPFNNSSASTGTRAPTSRNAERFVAAFRGRQMYGQAVDIPSGYGGLVLQAPLDSMGRSREDANKVRAEPVLKRHAAARRFGRTTTDDDTAEEIEGDEDSDTDPSPTRKLVPLSTFTSFMLWAPDRPLDEGSDEYVKTLVEWTRLAAEIHSYDE